MVGEWVETVNYPQAPGMSEDEVQSLFEQALFARLGTHNKDGTIHIAPVFFKYQDGEIWIATQDPSLKIRNIKRSSKVSVLVDISDVPFKAALVYGRAVLDYDDVINKRIKIFKRTRTRAEAEDYARKLSSKWKCVIVRIKPTKIVSFDYSKF
jgi:nitroimidazol reductase NimA-like FMN-containing flavoprotein (pyridoxamine 5'-phosphate oxidase superfamily)